MKKSVITSMVIIISLILTTLYAIGCSREKEKLVVEEKKVGQLTKPEDLPSDIPVISGEPKTIISEDVRKKWKGVKLVVEDLKRKSMDEYSLNIGEELKVPESRMTIKIVEFLPDLKINETKEGSVFTSETNELKNPAVHIVIKDDGNIVFKGWLFSLFPDIHPFRHDRFGVMLKEPIAAT